MARGNRPIEVRVDDATRDRWTAAARDYGTNLSDFIRAAVEARCPASVDMIEVKQAKAACERERFHRPGTFCKACGKVS